ncbi:MAG: hypothetical protein KF681_16430 [Bdellovibrionaceae bacterium]|nr:hypothetical protein [Pseudobdellovibrionaceae bacterium]
MKYLVAMMTLILVSGCTSPGPHATANDPGKARFHGRTPASGPRPYRIYASAGELGLAWGCQGQMVDFERLDTDEAYENEMIISQQPKCKIFNALVSIYEDRILKDLEDEDYWVVRSHGTNHDTRAITRLNAVSIPNFYGQSVLYTYTVGHKWSATDTLFLAFNPPSDNQSPATQVVFCDDCTGKAQLEITKALRWEQKIAQHAISVGFSTKPLDPMNLVTVEMEGSIPKADDTKEFTVKAQYEVIVNPTTKKMSLKFKKILSATRL